MRVTPMLNVGEFTYMHLCLQKRPVGMLWHTSWYEEGSEVPPFKSSPPPKKKFRDPRSSPSSLSILHMIPGNSPNSEMNEGHIYVGSTIQTNRKQMQLTEKISSNINSKD